MDAIWQVSSKPKKARTSMYKWLSSKMDIPFKETHVKYFTKEQCKKAIKILKPMYIQLYGKDLPWRKEKDVKMENLPIIKVFKIDYSFLMKNYLNPELWKKEWTLFAYKTFTITLQIYSIKTKEEKITFLITVYNHDINSNGIDNKCTNYIECSLKLEALTFLKRQINSCIFNTICSMEKMYFILETDECRELLDKKYEERSRLRQYAEEFLDECGVTSYACREAYIEAYVDENEQVVNLIEDYISAKAYTMLPDLFLTFLSTLEDDPKKEIRTKEIEFAIGSEYYKDVMERIQEFKLEFEDEENFEAEMKSKLEEVINNG